MPRRLPTLAPLPLERRRDPFDHRDWLFELKLDGFRALAYIEQGKVRLVSRNGITFKRFAPLATEAAVALRGIRNTILDGEVVCLDGDGCPVFNALLYRRNAPCFVAFDCLWLDGRDLRRLPLVERKRVLRRIIPRRPACVQYLPHVHRRGVDLFSEVVQRDLEGIVAKLKQAPYGLVSGKSPWVKIKNREYSHSVGRHEQFDGLRGEKRFAINSVIRATSRGSAFGAVSPRSNSSTARNAFSAPLVRCSTSARRPRASVTSSRARDRA